MQASLLKNYRIKTEKIIVESVHAELIGDLSKSLEWQSFYTNDLPLLLDISKEVQDVSVQYSPNKSQTKALAKLKKVSESEFQHIVSPEAPSVDLRESAGDPFVNKENTEYDKSCPITNGCPNNCR